mgnify:CR=1 FL=1
MAGPKKEKKEKKEKKLIVDHIAAGISKAFGMKPGPTVKEQIENYYKDSEPVGDSMMPLNLGKKKKEMKHGGAVKGKKCRIDGIAVRGKTRAKQRSK